MAASVEMASNMPFTRTAVARRLSSRVGHALWAERVTLAVSALALGLRLWGINFGLPYAVHPDEPVVVGTVLHMLRLPTANPDTFIYPSVLYYFLAVIGLLYQAFTGQLIGTPPGTTGLGLYPTPDAILWMRVGVALVCVAAVAVVYRTARALAGPWPALGAALLLAFSPLHIFQSQIATTDGISATGIALVAACCVLAVRTESRRAFWFAGAALGLATGIKYNVAAGGVMLVAALGIVLWRAHGRRPGAGWSVLADARLLALLIAPLIFLVTTPGALATPEQFLGDVAGVFLHYDVRGHPGVAGSSLVYTLDEMFLGYEAPLSVLACIGLGYAIVRRHTAMLVVGSGALAYFILVAVPKVHFERNLVPLWPLLAILAAGGIAALALAVASAGRIAASWPRRQRLAALVSSRWVQGGLLAAVLLLATVPTLTRTVQQDSTRSLPDVQATASAWINHHLPTGSRIAYESYSVTLNSGRFHLVYLRTGLYTQPLDWYNEQHIQYVVASQMYYYRFFDAAPTDFPGERAAYDSMFARWTVMRTWIGNNTDNGTPDGKIVLLRVTPPGTMATHPVSPYP